jgi:3-hydroxyisobutyrate dehydrogenase-like beta-hydroxyacid dehydrogenase
VQLSSESPEEARQFSAMVARLGGSGLDGAIATMPAGIGKDTIIYY